jgi:hypothetical protein
MLAMLAGDDLEPTLRDRLASLRLAVIGHVEWAEFLKVPRLPAPGEITHVTDRWETPRWGTMSLAIAPPKNSSVKVSTFGPSSALTRRNAG